MPRFVPRQRKHKVLARQNEFRSTSATSTDPNATIILPIDETVREERKRKLKEELQSQQGQISSKKQKRLDKYIENKLKKDENLEYLRLLEQEKEKIDAVKGISLNLGKRKFDDFTDRTGPKHPANVEESESDAESEDSFEANHREAFQVTDNGIPERIPVEQGSGLAKPLEIGEDGLPVIEVRPSHKKQRRKPQRHLQTDEDNEELWEGFSEEEALDPSAPNGKVTTLEADTIDFDNKGEEDGQYDDSDDVTDHDDDEEELELSKPESISEGDSSISDSSAEDGKPRVSVFKAWATQQLNQSLGYIPSYENSSLQLPPNPEKRAERPPVQQHSETAPHQAAPASEAMRKAYAVRVHRTEHMEQARSELPIVQREQEIMEAIHSNPVVIVKGETGSGKTTQMPQFLYEAGYGSPDGPTPGMIGITQPRRVAAVSMAKRVGDELGDHGDKVSYQIRFDSNVSSNTAVKFMTDGILLRELSQDLLLRKYSVIVIDEAHERSVNTDILIGLLSKIVPARMRKNQFNPNPTPLKLVIMSATLNIGDFVNDRLFPPGNKPPIVEAEGRQHRVTTHFALRSRADYVNEVVEKVRRAHRKLPKGGILVFLTGQNEIRQVGDRLQGLLVWRKDDESGPGIAKVHLAASEVPFETEDMEIEAVKYAGDPDDFDEVDILTHSEDEDLAGEFDVSDDEHGQSAIVQTEPTSSKEPYTSVHILPLYSQLSIKQQLRVFEPPPAGARPIVLATNVAETSLTIPGIRYVFDSGRSKERKYNLTSGVQSFEVDYISKASAAQRAGRAGRTGPGHCWRLYTSAVYEQFFPEHAEPEILRAPAESVVLQLKSFAYPKPIVAFPFPSAPHAEMLQKAERLLKNLGALTASGTITDLGKQLSFYPLSPRLGKLVSKGIRDAGLLPWVVSLVAGLAVSEIFVNEAQLDMTSRNLDDHGVNLHVDEEDEARDKRKQEYGRARATLSRQDKTSDAIKLLTAVSMYAVAQDKEQFCKDYFLRPKAMFEVSQLLRQLTSIVKANDPTSHQAFAQESKLASKHIKRLNVIAASGYVDQVAIRADLSPNPPDIPSKPRRAIDVPYLPLIPLDDHPSAPLLEKAVFIHPSSVLARQSHKDLPPYIVYTHLQKSQAHHVSRESSTKTRMFPLTPIDCENLLQLARDTALLEIRKPVPNTKIEDIRGTPKRRECWVSTELKGGPGFGWPMPPLRVRQVVDVKTASGWRVEEFLS